MKYGKVSHDKNDGFGGINRLTLNYKWYHKVVEFPKHLVALPQ